MSHVRPRLHGAVPALDDLPAIEAKVTVTEPTMEEVLTLTVPEGAKPFSRSFESLVRPRVHRIIA